MGTPLIRQAFNGGEPRKQQCNRPATCEHLFRELYTYSRSTHLLAKFSPDNVDTVRNSAIESDGMAQ